MKLDKYDQIFSLFIRTRADWTCERCGRQFDPPTTQLHCSHFKGRANKAVRWDPDNAFAHCFTCHQHLGNHPWEFKQWAHTKLGAEKFQALMVRARPTKLWTLKEKESMYRMFKEELKKYER